ncbi:SDR family oxidoreductase [Kibdelosporangium philippinense]|uniref:SDR family oxidoreductase n=1 Tax=Kibdelosporangium philippinense TaxID=211113 RepID=A0ABS8ZIQ2_9PSEU|nr:SDR family oxidoreductase [Kibdelosporangium philippinense]MCE7007666.1 SDR family oxidoreductase [Kibdelosporangium philippinense]
MSRDVLVVIGAGGIGLAWGKRGARVNTISPGVVSTSMIEAGLASENGAAIRSMIGLSPAGRMSTPDEIAAAAAFLLGPESTFITGSDLLIDGGATAVMRTPQS